MITEYAKYAEKNKEEYLQVLKKLISIPSPSYREKEIAEMILDFMKKQADENNYCNANIFMDDICNVYCEIGEHFRQEDECQVVCAHIDTVFPDYGEQIPAREENGRLYGLGAKDNCANVCALMFCGKYMFENRIVPKENLLLVFNVCEEGLGNLRGSRKILERYSGIKQFMAFDLDYTTIFHRAVGSARYEVKVSVKGGHAFNDFGNKNAIAIMSHIIQEFYSIDVSKLEGQTTYNVGTITGGTSVNAIAQECSALFEWRSDSPNTLEKMAELFEEILKQEEIEEEGEAAIEKKLIGLRPSMGIFAGKNERRHRELTDSLTHIIKAVTGNEPSLSAGSTDCNRPLSEGIPAVCTGTCLGQGEHTREEYIEISSLEKGLVIALAAVLGEEL